MADILALEARHNKREVLILQVFPGTTPKAACLTRDSKIKMIPIDELDVLWHYDEQKGWVADFENGEA